MANHSSMLAWKIPWMAEPGRLQSMGSRRVGHDWATLLSLFTFMHWRRKWQPTPVFLPGESQGRWSLASMGSHRVGHDWSDLAAAAAATVILDNVAPSQAVQCSRFISKEQSSPPCPCWRGEEQFFLDIRGCVSPTSQYLKSQGIYSRKGCKLFLNLEKIRFGMRHFSKVRLKKSAKCMRKNNDN